MLNFPGAILLYMLQLFSSLLQSGNVLLTCVLVHLFYHVFNLLYVYLLNCLWMKGNGGRERYNQLNAEFQRISSVQSLSPVRLFATPWTAAHQALLSITNSQRLSKLMSIESVMPSNHLILCRPLLLLPSISSNSTVQKHQFFGLQLSLYSNSHIHTWLLEKR